jgi:hypothetical protein
MTSVWGLNCHTVYCSKTDYEGIFLYPLELSHSLFLYFGTDVVKCTELHIKWSLCLIKPHASKGYGVVEVWLVG